MKIDEAEGPVRLVPARPGRALFVLHPAGPTGPVFVGSRWRAQAIRWVTRGLSVSVALLAVLVATSVATAWLSAPSTDVVPELPVASGAR